MIEPGRKLPPPPPPMRRIGGSGTDNFLSPVMGVIFGVAFMLAMTGPLWIKWL